MKKLFFTAIALVAFSAVSFAGNVEVKKEEPKKETVSNKKQNEVKKEAVVKNEEVRTVVCEATVGGIVHYQVYSCFFCWGGSANGCKAALLDSISE